MDYKKQIFKIINQFTKGVDTYHHNGSMWFIFTDEKKWVIELTEDGTLWYNFYFFQDCFKYLSLNIVENQHYITEWVEDTIQNGVRSTCIDDFSHDDLVEDIIQNGVRYTTQYGCDDTTFVESVIQNGIKYIKKRNRQPYGKVENIVKNGIKEINHCSVSNDENAKNAIEFGIKETKVIGQLEIISK